MHKSATKCNETICKWCKNKHGASKIIDTLETYQLTRWNIICWPKDQGGLGIKVLDIKNSCLLSKWLFKLLNEKGMWQELIHNKYLKTKTLSQVQAKPTDSSFWKGILRGKDVFFQCGSFVVRDGLSTRFWEDPWLNRTPLMTQYPSLYSIVSHKNYCCGNLKSTAIEYWI
jgi:hypothetical protein